MTTDVHALSALFRELFPGRPDAVGLARVAQVPKGVTVVDEAVSACALWRRGTTEVVAAGEAHGACAIGRLTQGFADGLPAHDAAVGAMVQVEYVDPAEVPLLPHFPRGHGAIVYGPLDRLPVAPEAALIIATPVQAMLLAEALGLVRAGAGGLPMTGRPTCIAVPLAVLDDTTAGSLACTGARIYAGIGADELVLVIAASRLAGLEPELRRLAAANRAVEGLAREAVAAAS